MVVAMVTAIFRFYGELKDFIAPSRRQRAFDCSCQATKVNIIHGCYMRSLKAEDQLREIVGRLDLAPRFRPFTLFLRCNAPLREVNKETLLASVPPAVKAEHTQHQTCEVCRRVFW